LYPKTKSNSYVVVMRWDKLDEKNFRRLSIWASLVRRVHRAGKNRRKGEIKCDS
jgi:hypothetical protein